MGGVGPNAVPAHRTARWCPIHALRISLGCKDKSATWRPVWEIFPDNLELRIFTYNCRKKVAAVFPNSTHVAWNGHPSYRTMSCEQKIFWSQQTTDRRTTKFRHIEMISADNELLSFLISMIISSDNLCDVRRPPVCCTWITCYINVQVAVMYLTMKNMTSMSQLFTIISDVELCFLFTQDFFFKASTLRN